MAIVLIDLNREYHDIDIYGEIKSKYVATNGNTSIKTYNKFATKYSYNTDASLHPKNG